MVGDGKDWKRRPWPSKIGLSRAGTTGIIQRLRHAFWRLFGSTGGSNIDFKIVPADRTRAITYCPDSIARSGPLHKAGATREQPDEPIAKRLGLPKNDFRHQRRSAFKDAVGLDAQCAGGGERSRRRTNVAHIALNSAETVVVGGEILRWYDKAHEGPAPERIARPSMVPVHVCPAIVKVASDQPRAKRVRHGPGHPAPGMAPCAIAGNAGTLAPA